MKQLALVIDLNVCVGCHACVTACKGWNTENYGAPLADSLAGHDEPVVRREHQGPGAIWAGMKIDLKMRLR